MTLVGKASTFQVNQHLRAGKMVNFADALSGQVENLSVEQSERFTVPEGVGCRSSC